MKPYIVYNIATGEIVQSGHCPDKLVGKQTGGRVGFDSMEGIGGDLTHYVKDNKVEKHTEDRIKKNKKASDEMVVPGLSKIEKILKHLKTNGINLGPDGDYL